MKKKHNLIFIFFPVTSNWIVWTIFKKTKIIFGFISKALAEGYSLKHPRLGEIEVRQFTEMKVLAKKANLPTNEYDELIKQVKIRVFGEENYENFFGNK